MDSKNQTPFSKQIFLSGPKVAIHFLSQKNGDLKIHLLESEDFTASFFIKLPPILHQNILEWLSLYAQKAALPALKLPRQILPPFSEEVLGCLERIPFGKTLSYGEIALQAGSQKASRAVGTICRLNAFPLFIPCHRVLPKSGNIGQYAFGSPIKKALLEFEGSI